MVNEIWGETTMLIVSGKIQLKILYWGPAGSGKTTCLSTLYKQTQTENLDVKPVGDLKEISMASGATLYFDRGVFASTHDPRIFYHTYTVAGQTRFGVLRRRLLKGTDGLIVVLDSQLSRWQDCMNSLKELRNFVGENMLAKIVKIILLNKKDLPNTTSVDQVKDFLRQLNLWSDVPEQARKNPKIYETIALYDQKANIYESFYDCARHTIEQLV